MASHCLQTPAYGFRSPPSGRFFIIVAAVSYTHLAWRIFNELLLYRIACINMLVLPFSDIAVEIVEDSPFATSDKMCIRDR